MSQHQDQYYVDKVINGETNVFSELVERYKHMVFTLAFQILRNREEAEEVAQDTFLSVFNSLQKFKGDSKFSTWVYKIAYNRSLDYLKKRKTTLVTETLKDYSVVTAPLEENILDQIENKERSLEIKKALELLHPEERTIVTLYYYDELSSTEISKIVELSSNTVKVKLFRSRRKLAELLNVGLETEKINRYGGNG